MNAGKLLAIVASLFFAVGAVQAGDKNKKKGDKGKGNKHWEQKFDEIDTDDDGKISKDEFVAFKKEHHKHDKKDKTDKKDKKKSE